MTRHALALLASLPLLACSQSHGSTGEGVCCPVTDFTGCSPGSTPLPGGGWAPSLDACSYTIEGYDGPPFVRVEDEHGCPRVQEDPGATWCGVAFIDAGTPGPVDAGRDAMTTGCTGLGPAACLASGCVPMLDDSCCPSCSEGPCADCLHWTFIGCSPPAPACAGTACGVAPSCGGAIDCTSAHVNAEDACDVAGCVPAYPSGTGEPDPLSATCVPIHRDVCATFCRRLPPPCPARTVPEGDGSCYTNRCIPAFVCE